MAGAIDLAESRLAKRRESKTRGDLWKIYGPLLAVVAIAFAVTLATLEPPPPTRFKLAAGAKTGAYYAYAERYRETLLPEGYEIEIVETAGSAENLELLTSGAVPLALVQGGAAAAAGESGEVGSLASLFYEPLWVFQRRDRAVEHLHDFAGLRLAVGEEGSGTRALVLPLLAANGVDGSTAELVELAAGAAAGELEAGTVDAAFFVTSPEAPYVARLLAREDVELLPITRSRAYRKDHPYLSRVELGEGVVDLVRNLPDYDVPMLATTASLVASPDLHVGLIPLLLEAAKKVHGSGSVFVDPGTFPSVDYVDFPMHRIASRYLTTGPTFLYRVLPYRTAAAIDRLKILLLPFITLLIPLFRIGPPIYRWRIRSRIYRWYEDLKSIDESRKKDLSAEDLDELLATVGELEQEVTDVSVPLSYMDEYYRLREHVELIRQKLEVERAGV